MGCRVSPNIKQRCISTENVHIKLYIDRFNIECHLSFLYLQIKEEKLRSMFGAVGSLTDCALKYTKEGTFRNFAFIGYSSEIEADQAIKQFNKTFINASRIYVRNIRGNEDMSKALMVSSAFIMCSDSIKI